MKEDFIMVHMHPTCSHCRDFIMFGNRWSCRGKNCDFRLCDACHTAEQNRPMELRHPLAEVEKHTFFAQVGLRFFIWILRVVEWF
jgi:E1A/CREB-binding protein